MTEKLLSENNLTSCVESSFLLDFISSAHVWFIHINLSLVPDSLIPDNSCIVNQLITNGYDLLDLCTFFTSGLKESRAWTIKKNTNAQMAAGVIHSDFQKKFIRAEAVSFKDFEKFGSAEKAKENGKLRVEGKDYVVKDGDVLFFRVNP